MIKLVGIVLQQLVRIALVLSRVHWVRPELVAEAKYLTWTDENLLRQVVYGGLREDKPVSEIRRSPSPAPGVNSCRTVTLAEADRLGYFDR